MKGKFIVLEGMDGTGKTTQSEMLKDWYESKGEDVVLTREPGGCNISEKIRDLILSTENSEMDKITEAMLYASARAQHVAQIIKPALSSGKVVICDRFIHSSIAYQGFGRGMGKDIILDINKHALSNIWPDITIFFDLEPKKCRMSETKDRIELSGEDFFSKVLKGYKSMYNDERCFYIDASFDKETIFKEIIKIIGREIQ